jgi:hypothetical protein
MANRRTPFKSLSKSVPLRCLLSVPGLDQPKNENINAGGKNPLLGFGIYSVEEEFGLLFPF